MAENSSPPSPPSTIGDPTPPPPAYTPAKLQKTEQSARGLMLAATELKISQKPGSKSSTTNAKTPVLQLHSGIISQPLYQQQHHGNFYLNVDPPPVSTTVTMKYRFTGKPKIKAKFEFDPSFTVSQAVTYAVEQHPEASVSEGYIYAIDDTGFYVHSGQLLTQISSPTFYITDSSLFVKWRKFTFCVQLLSIILVMVCVVIVCPALLGEFLCDDK